MSKRFAFLTSLVNSWNHRELHDIAASRGGIDAEERAVILAAMNKPRKSAPKATRAFKRSKGRLRIPDHKSYPLDDDATDVASTHP